MKPLHLTITAFTAFGIALSSAITAWSSRPELQLDAPTPDGKVTQLTAQLLEQAQFAHQRLDDRLAAKFLDRYLDSLDGSREVFLQSDVAEFHRFLPQLAQATRREGDTKPARAIYERYLQRLGERAAFAAKTLAEETFEFTGHDHYSTDRENASRPSNIAEAHKLWRQRLRAEYLQEKLGDKKAEQIVQSLTRRYARQEQTMKKLSSDAVLELYLNALAHVYDPHSDFLGREQLASFNIGMKLSLAGIGATLQTDDGYCKIRELVPGGPAARSGKLKVGDRIVAVSQQDKEPVDLVDMPLPQAVDLIRGAKGTNATLTIIPAGADESTRNVVTITRDEIRLDEQQAKARIVDFPDSGSQTVRMGVIDLPSFYSHEGGGRASATADVAQLIRKLQGEGVRGLILDLRRNGGGSLQEAIDLTGLFIPSGPVVQTRDLKGSVEVGTDRDGKTLYDGPLVVLTSRFSASASEIVAGALQDYGRALIVGDSSTFGKGTVQTMLPLGSLMQRNGASTESDPGALKVTISKFYRPGGSSTQLRGVKPEIVLPSVTDTSEISEAGMKNAMPWDSVPARHFDRFDLVQPFAATLRKQSSARLAADKDFAWLREDLALVEKNRATKSISLNEAERRREKDEAKNRTTARNAERNGRKEASPTTYEITVKNAATPGLPSPIDPNERKDAMTTAPDEQPDAAEPSSPKQDILLTEAQRILKDYLQLLNRPSAPALTKS